LVAIEQGVVKVVVGLAHADAVVVRAVAPVRAFEPRGPSVAIVVAVLIVGRPVPVGVVIGPIAIAVDVLGNVGDVVGIAIAVVVGAITAGERHKRVGPGDRWCVLEHLGRVGQGIDEHGGLRGEEKDACKGHGARRLPKHGVAPPTHAISSHFVLYNGIRYATLLPLCRLTQKPGDFSMLPTETHP